MKLPRWKKILYSVILVLILIAFAYCCSSRGTSVPEQSAAPAAAATPLPSAVAVTPEPTAFISPDANKLVISELMVKNRATLQDCDGDFSDWFEIENISGDTVSLSGWAVSDGETKDAWRFPDLSLAPGEQLLVFASGKNRSDSELHTDFSLSIGETLSLYAPESYLTDSVLCEIDEADHSYARQSDGSFTDCVWPTPGYENSDTGYESFCASRTHDGPLIISEVMVYNNSYERQAKVGCFDWVEITNISDAPVELSDYYLSDTRKDYMLWRFPECSLSPGDTFTVFCSGDESLTAQYFTHTNFSLDAVSEQLYLTDGSKRCVTDYVWLHDIPYGCSYGRVPGENGFFYLYSPTPRAANSGDAFRQISSMPQSPTVAGVYNNIDSLSVELQGTGRIYYTTNGSLPTRDSAEYTEPISLSSTSVIRAICAEDGKAPSRALTLSFIINENHTLPVLSLATDDPALFNNTYWNARKYFELPANLSFFDTDGSFSQDCGVKMKGWTSLEMPKKSMGVTFRGVYGESLLNYDIFDGGVSEFRSLSIRSGQDYPIAIIRNELFQNLCLEASDNVPAQRSKYCILYVNGDYRGIYALKEDFTRQYYASQKDVSKDEVLMYRSPVDRSSAVYQEVFAYVYAHDMTQKENYDHICSVLDIDSLVDWFLLEGYCVNTDANGNMRYFRTEGGKWQIAYYDLDWSFGYPVNSFTNITNTSRVMQINDVLKPLLQNEEFKDKLLRRYAELVSTTLSNEHVLAKIDELQALLEPEVYRERDKWGSSVSAWHDRLNDMRSYITANDYENYTVDRLCSLLGVSEAKKQEYFGAR